MATNASAIVVGASGDLYVAPTGTTLPTDSQEALDVGFLHTGIITEDGASLTSSRTVTSIGGWQSLDPYRRVKTAQDLTVGLALREWNKVTVPLAFGGGTITEPDSTGNPGEFKYSPPAPADRDPRALVLQWVDGTKDYRLVVPEVEVTDTVTSNLLRTGPADLPLVFGVNATDGSDPWNFFTNDPAWDPA